MLEAGSTPLPPYILKARRRCGLPLEQPELDRERYQTVFARHAGAVAAPTAGLHFTREMLGRLGGRGMSVRALTLMVGPGTFRPVKSTLAEDHELAPESYRLPEETASAVAGALEVPRVCGQLYLYRDAGWLCHVRFLS